MSVRRASLADHESILKMSRLSPHSRDFSHMMFSGESAYEKGWIRIFDGGAGSVLGFTCVRHKVRSPETSLYFIAVHPKCKRQGIGEALLKDLKEQTPHNRIVLNVTKTNEEALQFYKKHGFTNEGDSLKGKGFKLTLEW